MPLGRSEAHGKASEPLSMAFAFAFLYKAALYAKAFVLRLSGERVGP